MKLRILLNIGLALAVLSGAGGGVAWMVTRPGPVKPPRPAPPLPKVAVEEMRPIDNYTVKIVGYGSARPRISVEIVPQVSGKVTYCSPNCRSGKYVTKDETLFKIDPTDFTQARDAALRQIDLLDENIKRLDQEKRNLLASEKLSRSRVALAEEQLADATRLRSSGAAGTNDVDSAQDALLARREQLQQILSQKALIAPQRAQFEAEQAVRRVQVEQAKTSLARATFKSPVTGRVLSAQVEDGTRVIAGKTYGELYNLDLMEIPVPVLSSDLHWVDRRLLRPGPDGKTPAEKDRLIRAEVQWFGGDNERRLTWEGYVGRMEAGLDAKTRTAKLVVYVENAPINSSQEMLDRNMFCRVVIHGRTVPRALILPRQAVSPGGEVYVVEDGRLQVRTVTVQRYTDSDAMVFPEPDAPPSTQPATRPAWGLRAGDLVCTGYVPKSKPNMRVDVLPYAGSATRPASQPAAGALATEARP